ncbi:superoxide dismutase [Deinococcus wulumuqiensis]|uniref:Superoxide dismutase n=1 Tax=Deinococcus wulumuqiensis TaxID=980427 RepID=A0A345IF80_9DEIO|nr:superoxide dismutase family protein [Deinococcus wulumuqiensis]AXG98352.1 superoxide dismutase [Deinococcus wulumuqiensis]
MFRFVSALPLLALSLSLSGCADLAQPTVRADLLDQNGKVIGTATLRPEPIGTRASIEVSGLTPGQHALHIHENPTCEPGPDATGQVIPFGAAGGHFDPGASKNHDGPQARNDQGHGGDLPMIEVGDDGKGKLNFDTNRLKMSGPTSVLGRSIVIHEKADDYQTDPAGNSGGRVACGVLVAVN